MNPKVNQSSTDLKPVHGPSMGPGSPLLRSFKSPCHKIQACRSFSGLLVFIRPDEDCTVFYAIGRWIQFNPDKNYLLGAGGR